ncbi:hypothetical protein [Vibrio sp. AND4]|uniref:hypothetical protein n=1 Tax=Vibrio sp. AND4 TaxID=314289 RepID=UPI00015F2F65|nr:hypothetical protein [Vibrio sp. AND4]EDP60702.1 hypothetical protein AND4_07279 [Vibrio sp. AND4]
MNIKKNIASLAILTAFNATAYEHYSVFEDYIDQGLVTANQSRITQIGKSSQGQQTVAGTYVYDQVGRVTQRDYVDSKFHYTYNAQGWLESARALMKHGPNNSYIRQTKENFISQYSYNELGQVSVESKKVFHNDAANLNGTPIATYRIQYTYGSDGKLLQRRQEPMSGDDMSVREFYYSYHDDGKLRKIREVKLSEPKEKSTLLLQYYPNGEIRKATQSLFGKGTKTFEMEYVNDDSLIYGVYYVDPVKEWKVDLNLFSLAFHPIKSMTQTAGDSVSTYRYQYQNIDGDALPDSIQLEITLPGFSQAIQYNLTNQ